MKLLSLFIFSACMSGLVCCNRTEVSNAAINTSAIPPSSSALQDNAMTDPEYSALLSILGDSKSIVVKDQTMKARFEQSSMSAKTLPNLRSETVLDFNQKNSAEIAVDCRFPTYAKCSILNQEDLTALFDFKKENATTKWKSFKARYGTNTFFTLSRVGFSNDSQQGFAYVKRTCGTLCADYIYYLLNQESGAWKVTAEMTTGVE